MKWLWRRLPRAGWKRWASLFGLAVGSLVVLVGCLAVTVFILARDPAWRIWFFSKVIKHTYKDFPDGPPEPKGPPATWHQARLDVAGTARAADLFQTTRVWPVQLRFTEREWRDLTPTKIPELTDWLKGDGTMTLRNPLASRAGVLGVLGLDLPWSSGELQFAGVLYTNVAVRYKGNGTFLTAMDSYKRPFKLDVSRANETRRLAGVRILNLGNLLADPSVLSDAMAYELFREVGVPAPRTAFARVTLTVKGRVDGRVLGLYEMVENPDRDWVKDRFGPAGAVVFKPVTNELFSNLGTNWGAYEPIYHPKTPITAEQKARLMALTRFVSGTDDAAFEAGLKEYFDLDEVARFFACEVLLSNYDGILSNGQNFLLYLEGSSGRFGFGPWDLDQSWGGYNQVGSDRDREQAPIWRPWVGENRFLSRLFKSESFRARYRAALEEMLSRYFLEERLSNRIGDLAELVRPFVAEEALSRLARFEVAVTNRWGSTTVTNVSPFDPSYPPRQLHRFIHARRASVRDQLDGKSQGATLKRVDF